MKGFMPDVWHIRTIHHTRYEPETMTGAGKGFVPICQTLIVDDAHIGEGYRGYIINIVERWRLLAFHIFQHSINIVDLEKNMPAVAEKHR